MSTALTKSEAGEKLASFRREFIDELPNLAREYIDVARAEGTAQAYEKVMNTAIKVIDGLQVDTKPDKYANLPVIHMTIGANMEVVTRVEAAPLPAADVVDVESRPVSPFGASAAKAWELPANPADLLPPQDDPDTIIALDLAASAMALPDD